MQPLSSNWSRNRCRQNMLEDNTDWNFQHLCLCYVVSCYIDILCTSVCSTSPFFIYLHFFSLHPHRKTGHERDRVTSFNRADGGIIIEQCLDEGSWSSRKECQHLGMCYDCSVAVASQMRGELIHKALKLWQQSLNLCE